MRDFELKALDVAAQVASAVAKLGGPVGVGATAVAALLGTTATAMRPHNLTTDQILAAVRDPGPLASWREIRAQAQAELDAEPITKSEKLKSEPPR